MAAPTPPLSPGPPASGEGLSSPVIDPIAFRKDVLVLRAIRTGD